jgi:hypothetical protein
MLKDARVTAGVVDPEVLPPPLPPHVGSDNKQASKVTMINKSLIITFIIGLSILPHKDITKVSAIIV